MPGKTLCVDLFLFLIRNISMSNSLYFQKRKPIFVELGLQESALFKLEKYVDLLWSENEDLNLISRKMTYADLIDNHVIDCLLPLRNFPKQVKSAADFGSGGGLPGIIYAIQFPHVHFHLFEKSVRKQQFLNKCREITKNFEVHGLIPDKLKNTDLIIARGFKPLDGIIEMSREHYHAKGRYFLLKARSEKIEEELLLARQKFKNLQITKILLNSPVLEVERHLVLIN